MSSKKQKKKDKKEKKAEDRAVEIDGLTQELLNNSDFSDLQILAGPEGKPFHVHKAILALYSPTLRDRLKAESVLKYPDISPEIMTQLLQLVYTNYAKIPKADESALFTILKGAQTMGLELIQTAVLSILMKTPSMFDNFFRQAFCWVEMKEPPLRGLQQSIISAMCNNTKQCKSVLLSNDILVQIPLAQIRAILSHQEIPLLESEVFNSANEWAKAHAKDPSPLSTLSFVENVAAAAASSEMEIEGAAGKAPAVSPASSTELTALQSMSELERTRALFAQLRPCIKLSNIGVQDAKELLYPSGLFTDSEVLEIFASGPPKSKRRAKGKAGGFEFPFDASTPAPGILHFLGKHHRTGKGLSTKASEWTNPHRSGAVVVSSDPAVSQGDISMVVAEYDKTASMLLSLSNDRQLWQMIDFGEHYSVALTGYRAKYGHSSEGSGIAAPANWRLEGSTDGKEWVTLRQHTADPGLHSRGAYAGAAWPIEGFEGEFFRYVRVLKTGHNWVEQQTAGFSMTCLEFYGSLSSDAAEIDE